jgi:hypothetical protein
MACLLSKQDDFANQVSQLKIIIKNAGHECIFLLPYWADWKGSSMGSSETEGSLIGLPRCYDAP